MWSILARASNPMISPYLLAGDRYKIAVETRRRAIQAVLFRVPRRDLIANECGGVTVSPFIDD